jgi:PAS domain S-box-containing protein
VSEPVPKDAPEAARWLEPGAPAALARIPLDRIPLGCVLLEPDGTITDWNPWAERIFGWTREEALGRNVTELIVPEEIRPRIAASLRELVCRTEIDTGINENVTKTGQRITCEWHDAPLRDEGGKVVGILAMARDVSDRIASEAELRASRGRLVRLLERLPVATAVVRGNGTIESFNLRAIELFGADATSVPTLPAFIRQLLPEGEERRTVERALGRIQGAAASGLPEPSILLAARRRDGREVVVAADCVVVDDLVVWTATDLTEVLRLEAERARLGRIIEESIDEVFVFDAATLRFRNANRSARDNVGYTLEELRERTPLDVKPELTEEAFARTLAALRSGASRGERFETVHRRKDGSTYPVEVHLQLSAEGGDPVFVAVIQDITVRRRAEEVVRGMNAELEARVRARTRELEESNRELEAFAYSVSHDLRAPLRAIDGFSQLLVEEHGGRLDEEALRYLSRIRGGAQRMGNLIDDLLRLSRVARAVLKVEPVDVTALALALFGELRAADPARRVETVVAPGLVVRADPDLFRILLDNLLQNAWKFTSLRDDARIEVGAEGAGPGATFFVRDDGAGFEMAFAGQLFKPFLRLHAPSEFGGTGIGLAIVDRIVRRHGGRVEGIGTPGEGATFRFRLGEEGG